LFYFFTEARRLNFLKKVRKPISVDSLIVKPWNFNYRYCSGCI